MRKDRKLLRTVVCKETVKEALRLQSFPSAPPRF